MAEALTPTLEDLRDVPEAAWLWDGARARIVWANRAGVAYFGGDSLFDLIDRPFDFSEPGVERIVALSRSLARGQVAKALLHFPSAGTAAPLPCKCMVHALSDGRPGILAVATVSAAAQGAASSAAIVSAFDLLPDAALLTGDDGTVRHLNAAALLLLGAGQRANLAGLLGDQALAEDLLARAGAAGTVSLVRALAVRLGQRDIRITLRRLPQQTEGAHVMVLLDDVTERRALEQKLAKTGVPPAAAGGGKANQAPALNAADADAFEKLGKALSETVRHVPRRPEPSDADSASQPAEANPQQPAAAPIETASATPPEPAAPKRPPPAPLRRIPHIPAILREPLDKRPEAILIAQDGQLLYGNPVACVLLGFDNSEALINDSKLCDRFGQLGQSLPASDVELDGGRSVTASIQLNVVPWHGGPARQFILRKAEPARAEALTPQPAIPVRRAEAKIVSPVQQPAETPQVPGAEIIPLPQRNGSAEADAELRAILDTATDGIITLDAKGNIHTFSAGAEAIFGYRIAEVAGKPIADLFQPESRKVLRDYLAALQGPGLASVFNDGREVTAVVKQGGSVPLFLTIGKLQAPKSQAAFCAVVRDITQWKKTETELREAKEKAEATSRQKSEFLARISHELRTPLNAIMGFSEVMRLARFGEIENEKYRGYVNDIHASGSHLLSLINDLLDLSKVEAGKLELNFTSVNLGDVIDHGIKMLQEQATAARVVLRKAWGPELPNVVADLRSMRQIMMNLLSNAIKFTDPGGQVIISGQLTEAGELKLRVKDTGIGMTEDQLRDALEPFRRVSTPDRDMPGTGLGLPLTRALAEANRTAFAITSEPRKGTLVEITFPTTRVLAG
ncbi:MAG: PAS domain S-box protein [Alphaproteobacteria bacterium]|nr:PAS domain S-box protein [Alphaproteobacteria bacterium]